MTYEPDGGWVLTQEHLDPVGDGGRARTVRLAIEKNCHGPSEVEWRHQLCGERFFLEPEGSMAPVEESFQIERILATGRS
jgi:hypothetical protein